MVNQDLGRVAVVLRGEYDPAAEYERLDCVSYQGSSWLVRKHCMGVIPAEGEYYQIAALAGSSAAADAAALVANAAAQNADAAAGRADVAAGNAQAAADAVSGDVNQIKNDINDYTNGIRILYNESGFDGYYRDKENKATALDGYRYSSAIPVDSSVCKYVRLRIAFTQVYVNEAVFLDSDDFINGNCVGYINSETEGKSTEKVIAIPENAKYMFLCTIGNRGKKLYHVPIMW